MFWVGFIVGLVLGANISLFLYAIILTGKQSDGKIKEKRWENDISKFIIK